MDSIKQNEKGNETSNNMDKLQVGVSAQEIKSVLQRLLLKMQSMVNIQCSLR